MNLLEEAQSIISGDRNATHGTPERNFATIARYWSAYLETDLTPADVAKMMVLMKVARTQSGNPRHRDHYVDMAGYSAIAWEIESCSVIGATEKG